MRRINLIGGILSSAAGAVVAAVSLVPGGSLPPMAPGGDKLAHFLAYAGMGLCFFVWFIRPEGGNLATGLAAIVCAGLLGGLLEVAQPFFGRSMEFWDFVSDVGGAFFGVAAGEAAWFALKKRKNWTDSVLWFKLFSEGSMNKDCCGKERR